MIDLMGLYDLADEDNIVIDEYPMQHHLSFSIMDLDGDCYIAIDPFKLGSAQQEKMVLAHEIGHCETGSFYNRFSGFDIRKRHENRADKWAIIHLVPEDELNEAVSAGLTELWELADYFDVSLDFMRKAVHWYKHHNMDCS